MKKPCIGLLPLYLELYDRFLPAAREKADAFAATVAKELGAKGINVHCAPVCRLRGEVAAAVRDFEMKGAAAIVSLHLAYSPSLEIVDALAATSLPLIVLDTTPEAAFGPDQSPQAIMHNHGIHGVQDLCNLLLRRGKDFRIEAGHWQQSDVLDRLTGWCRAAAMAATMRSIRAGRIGAPFAGMGDFDLPPDELQAKIGISVLPARAEDLRRLLPGPEAEEVRQELAADARRFRLERVSREAHAAAVRTGLALRRWLEEKELDAFSINFLSCGSTGLLPTMPFLEICKAMARGIGYAGEGDLLTASLLATLSSLWPESTFSEMFCPDWAGNSIFLSHMGEVNCDLIAGRPALMDKPFPWTDAGNAVSPVGCLRSGPATLVNLAPAPAGAFSLLLAPAEMLEGGDNDNMKETVHGWLRPGLPLNDFLAEYSRHGGTHHSALVYGRHTGTLCRFGSLMGWKVTLLSEGSNGGKE